MPDLKRAHLNHLNDLVQYLRTAEAEGMMNLEGLTPAYATYAHELHHGDGWEPLTEQQENYVYRAVERLEHADRVDQALAALAGAWKARNSLQFTHWTQEVARRVEAYTVADSVATAAEMYVVAGTLD